MRLLRGNTRAGLAGGFLGVNFHWWVGGVCSVLTLAVPICGAQLTEGAGESVEVLEGRVSLPGLGEGIGAVYRECCLSVVSVRAKTEIGERLTTGFFVGDGSVIATVFEDDSLPETVSVVHVDKVYPAKVVVMDERMRVALLVATGLKGKPLEVDDRSDGYVELAERLYAITESPNPLFRAMEGRVAGVEKLFRSRVLPVKLLRVNLQGTSEMLGAPLVSDEGKVAGVVLFETPDASESFYALPATIVTKIYEDFANAGKLQPGWLGILLEEGTTTPRILECVDGGAAEEVGLQPGDVILRVGRRGVREYQDVVDSMYFLRPGQITELEILRGLEKLTVKVVPKVKPAATKPSEGGAGVEKRAD